MPSEDTQFKPGEGGRPKGVQNKLTRTVKETVLEVFNAIQEDPKVKLEQFAKDHPRDFYNIAAKLIPTEISAKVAVQMPTFVFEPDKTCDPIED